MNPNKQAALDFLEMVNAGNIDEAYEKYIYMDGRHHNTFTPAGMSALRQGMKDAHIKFPNKQFSMQHVLSDGELVAVHSHMTLEPGKLDFATMHLFRFRDGKVVELWDMSQTLEDGSPNADGAF